MRWRSGRRSDNIEDRRDGSYGEGGRVRLPTGRRMPVGRRTAAGGGLGLVVVIVVALLFGVDPSLLLGPGGPMTTETRSPADVGAVPPGTRPGGEWFPSEVPGAVPGLSRGRRDELADFVSVVLADTEDTWNAIFADGGARYREPRLVLFTDAVRSACGLSEAALGPFYCPADEKVYIDLSFYDELRNRYHAPGDFAQAYVIAHEVGHHVQKLLGISEQVARAQRAAGESTSNQLSVKLELQADCLAGVWAHHAQAARNILEEGDLEEGINAAAQIGDDRMQKRAMGYVVPDSFTHGSSAQRVHWFRQGFAGGDLDDCDTFGGR